MSNTLLTKACSCSPFFGGALGRTRGNGFHRNMNELDIFDLFFDRDNIEKAHASGQSTIKEEDKQYIIEAIIPGVAKEDLQVEFKENILSITNKPPQGEDEAKKQADYYYEYRFYIHNNVDTSAISADLSRGVLTLTLPKKEEAKAQLIEIQEYAS